MNPEVNESIFRVRARVRVRPRTPAFRVLSGVISLVGPTRDSASILSYVMTLSTKMAAPVKRFIFFIFVPRWSF